MNPAPSKSAMYTAFVYTCFAWSCHLVQPPFRGHTPYAKDAKAHFRGPTSWSNILVQPPAPHNAARTNLLASTESKRC